MNGKSIIGLRPTACVLVAGFVFALTGCKTTDFQKHAERFGLPVGSALLVGYGCNQLFRGKERSMATAICAAGGAWLGTRIRDYLNEREQAQLAEATYTTLDTGRRQSIRTEDGKTITTEVVKSPAASRKQTKAGNASGQTAPPVAIASSQQECGTVKQTVVTNDNQRFEDTVSACKSEDGTWVAA